MPIIVEDGSGLANAESYISVADADAYHTLRGNAAWDLAADKEASLRKATDYMQQVYRTRWLGWRKTLVQALEWPRLAVLRRDFGPFPAYVANDIVPTAVANACAEFAMRAAVADLFPDLARAKASVKLADLEVVYDQSSPEQKRYPSVEMMLAIYFRELDNTVELVRT